MDSQSVVLSNSNWTERHRKRLASELLAELGVAELGVAELVVAELVVAEPIEWLNRHSPLGWQLPGT